MVEVVLVDPKVTVLAPAPVARLTVVAAASVEMPMAPVPELCVCAPLVEVIFNAPEPDCTVVADVLLVDPKVEVFTAPPVATFTVVAEASVDIPRVPVPEFIVRAPLVDVTFNAPLPDCTVVVEVEFVDPTVVVFTAPPVATLTVVADASVLIASVLVPELRVMAVLLPLMVLFQLLFVLIFSPQETLEKDLR